MSKESFEPQLKPQHERPELESAFHPISEKPETARKRSPHEIQELKDKLRFVAKNLSKNFNLNLIPGQGWAAGLSKKFEEERRKHPEKSLEDFDEKLLVPEVMTYPEQDLLERSEDYIFGVFRHEMGHIKHSDYQSLLESQELAKQEGYKPLDLFTIYDAWEDGRSNNQEGQTSRTARHRLGAYLKEDIAQALLHDFEKKSLPIQYGLLCWAKGAEPFIEGFDFEEIKSKIKDEKVLKAFGETEGVLDEYLNESKGRRAFKEVMWEKGWPVFKELIDKYIEEEAQKQHAQDQQQQQGDQGQEQQKQESQGQEGEEDKKEKQEDQEGKGDSQKKQEKASEQKEGGQKSWDELSDEEKDQYRQKAREKLDEEEREFTKQLQPKSVEMKENEDGTMEIQVQMVTQEDMEQAIEEEKEYQEREKKRQEQIQQAKSEVQKNLEATQENLKERMTGLTKEERERYDTYYSQIKKYVGMLVERLDEVFPPQEEAEWEGGYRRGKRIDPRKLAREIPTQEGRFFERKDVPEVKAVAFSLLVDVSGSMDGEKIQEALKAAILMAEAFSQKGVPFEILAFHAQLLELKGFDETYFGKKKLEIMRVLREVKSSGAQYNDDGFAVDSAARRLQKRLLENDASGALIVFSDGQPAPSSRHAGSEWELREIVRKWTKQIPLIGIGIGPGMERTIKQYYDKNGLPVPDIHKLPQSLLKILEKQLQKFERSESK